MKTPRKAVIVSLAAVSLLGTACSSSGGAKQSGQPAPAGTSGAASTGAAESGAPGSATTITIKDFKFAVQGPAGSGKQVTVTNNDTAEHTVTSDGDGGFDVKVGPGQTATFDAPGKAGTFPFHCDIHPQMKGELQVS